MAVSVAVCDIFNVKEWCDLENMVGIRSRSLKMAPFDRSHTITGRNNQDSDSAAEPDNNDNADDR